jgi:hypothetical protein
MGGNNIKSGDRRLPDRKGIALQHRGTNCFLSFQPGIGFEQHFAAVRLAVNINQQYFFMKKAGKTRRKRDRRGCLSCASLLGGDCDDHVFFLQAKARQGVSLVSKMVIGIVKQKI